MESINNNLVTSIILLYVTVTRNIQAVESTTPHSQVDSGVISGDTMSSNDIITYDPSDPISCKYDFTGPADDIFILDRSESVNQANFNKSKAFVADVIRTSFLLRPDVNRISIITYTSSATMKMDMIRKDTEIYPECEVFLKNGLWDSIVYDSTNKNGQSLEDALLEAQVIFSNAARTDVKRRLWILTDFHNTEISTAKLQSFSGIEIYGVGVGTYNKDVEDQAFYNMIQEDPGCRYRKLTRGDRNWEEALITFRSPAEKVQLDLGEYVEVSEDHICHSFNCTGGCQCQEFNPLVTLRCSQDAVGSEEESDDDESFVDNLVNGELNPILVVLACAFCIIIVVIIILVCCIKCRRKQYHDKSRPPLPAIPSSHSISTTTEVNDACTYTSQTHLHSAPSIHSIHSIESYLDPVTDPANIQIAPKNPHETLNSNKQRSGEDTTYVNGDLADILKAHGVVQDSTLDHSKHNNKTNNKKGLLREKFTWTRENKKDKLYKKNPDLKDGNTQMSHINTNTGDRLRNFKSNHCNDWDNNRRASGLSDAQSSHSYFEPIPDYPKLQKGDYSYAYDMYSQTVPANRPKPPSSCHSYEGIDFTNTVPKPQKKQPDVIPKRHKNANNHKSHMDTELSSKLQKIRKRISAAFASSDNKQEVTNQEPAFSSVQNQQQITEQQNIDIENQKNSAVQNSKQTQDSKRLIRFPKKFNADISINNQLKEDEAKALYIDPATRPQNAKPLGLAISSGTENKGCDYSNEEDETDEEKRKSSKLGTVKFKNLLFKFADSTKDSEHVKVSHMNQTGYEPGPNGPYSVVVNHAQEEERNSSGSDMPQAFIKIM